MTERGRATAPSETAEAVNVLAQIHQLVDLGKLRQAFAAAEAGLGRMPGSPALNFQLGRIAEMLISSEPDGAAGSAEIAEESFRRALGLQPTHSDAAAGLARILDRKGDTQAAMATLAPFLAQPFVPAKVAIAFAAIGPRLGEAERACQLLGEVVAAEGEQVGSSTLHQYARLLDRLKRFDEAFAVAVRANERAERYYRSRGFTPGMMLDTVKATVRATPRRAMVSAPRATNASALPVFIVGMGRSGTTLVEQIIDSHPDAHGGGERRALMRAGSQLAKLTGIDMPTGMARWPREALDRVATDYLRELAALAPGAKRITDKLPQNFLRLGIVQRLLPGARIIHCRRDPRDILISAYFEDQKIPAMEPWDLFAAARVYRLQERLMAHWYEVLDLEILPVQYESLVQQPEIETRRLIAFLGLPWDDRCLAIDENRRVVDTTNYASVRRRIHGGSVGRWRNYEGHLGPMIEALQGRLDTGSA